MRILLAVGTRPEIIKMSPVLKALKGKADVVFVHSGQHYDAKLSGAFFSALSLPEPDENLEVGSGSQAEQTSAALIGFERLLKKYRPDIACVQGDTNTALACALASVKIGIPVAHIEAGIRSFDRRMPEEINRILIDACSELLFAPTEAAALNLIFEGIPRKKISITGNTISDACTENILRAPVCEEKEFCILTTHRPENTDSGENIEALISLIEKIQLRVIFPAHPRFIAKAKESGLLERLEACRNLELREPAGYLEFLSLLKGARFALTDSGGVQEEALLLGTPCLTLRKNTERPETVETGGNFLVGLDSRLALEYIKRILTDPAFEKKMRSAKSPYGKNVGRKIADILLGSLERGISVRSSDFIKKPYPLVQLRSGIEGKVQDLEKKGAIMAIFQDKAVFPEDGKDIKKKDCILFRE